MMALPNPFPQDLEYQEHLAALDEHEDEQYRVRLRGTRRSGTTVYVRFEPTRAAGGRVRFHVQSTATGGTAAYSAAAFVVGETETVDCTPGAITERSVALDGVSRFVVWLVPVSRQGTVDVLLDGVSGADCMTCVDLGV